MSTLLHTMSGGHSLGIKNSTSCATRPQNSSGAYIASIITCRILKAICSGVGLGSGTETRLSRSVPWCFSERDGLDVQHLNLVHRADGECVIIHQSKTAIGKNRKVITRPCDNEHSTCGSPR